MTYPTTPLSKKQIQILEKLANATLTPQEIAIRSTIILLHAQGKKPSEIREEMGITFPPIYKWIKRWSKAQLMLDQIEEKNTKDTNLKLKKAIEDTLSDAFRSGAPSKFTEEQVVKIIALACTSPETLQLPVSHWSCRLLAEYVPKMGIAKSISYKQINVFLKSRANKTTQNKMLVKF